MELIKQALGKAKQLGTLGLEESHISTTLTLKVPAWCLRRVQLDAKHLERKRIVSLSMSDPSHVAFNLLRTKIYKALKDRNWKTLAILSPTAGCGKTMVAINLALTLARQAACKTVLLDLDFRKSAVAKTLGIETDGSLADYLEDKVELEHCFAQVSDNLIVGLNNRSLGHSAEMMQEQRFSDMLLRVQAVLVPDVMVFDLPPMLSSDDAIAFLPRVDCSLLVVAAGQTTPAEIRECERQARAAGNFLGVVLNKAQTESTEYYQYGM